MKKLSTLSFALIAAIAVNAQTETTVTFESAELPDNGILMGKSHEEGGFVFDNYYTNGDYEYNSGYTVSNNTDRNSAGFMNQYSVDARSGADGSNNFLIYNACYYADCYIHRTDDADFTPLSMAVAMTTYVSLSVQDGDAYAKKFGTDDHFTMTVTGLDAFGEKVGSIDIKLVNYPMMWMPWAKADLSALGKVNKLFITFASTDNSYGYMNTPAYVALDNFTATITESTDVAVAKLPSFSTTTTIHNLSGQRLNDITTPGVYIVNGRRVMVK